MKESANLKDTSVFVIQRKIVLAMMIFADLTKTIGNAAMENAFLHTNIVMNSANWTLTVLQVDIPRTTCAAQ